VVNVSTANRFLHFFHRWK